MCGPLESALGCSGSGLAEPNRRSPYIAVVGVNALSKPVPPGRDRARRSPGQAARPQGSEPVSQELAEGRSGRGPFWGGCGSEQPRPELTGPCTRRPCPARTARPQAGLGVRVPRPGPVSLLEPGPVSERRGGKAASPMCTGHRPDGSEMHIFSV